MSDLFIYLFIYLCVGGWVGVYMHVYVHGWFVYSNYSELQMISNKVYHGYIILYIVKDTELMLLRALNS